MAISLATKGANENGLIEMYRRPMAERTAFDVVVKPGESIQAAIEKAPEIPTVPFKILLLNGTYHQKVIIDRPNIVLVGKTVTVRGLSWLKQPRHVPSRNIMDVR